MSFIPRHPHHHTDLLNHLNLLLAHLLHLLQRQRHDRQHRRAATVATSSNHPSRDHHRRQRFLLRRRDLHRQSHCQSYRFIDLLLLCNLPLDHLLYPPLQLSSSLSSFSSSLLSYLFTLLLFLLSFTFLLPSYLFINRSLPPLLSPLSSWYRYCLQLRSYFQ